MYLYNLLYFRLSLYHHNDDRINMCCEKASVPPMQNQINSDINLLIQLRYIMLFCIKTNLLVFSLQKQYLSLPIRNLSIAPSKFVGVNTLIKNFIMIIIKCFIEILIIVLIH